MLHKPICTLAELRAEKKKLRWEITVREAELEAELKQLQSIINTPFRWFRTIRNLFSQNETGKSDIVSILAQLGLPMLLNAVIFKKIEHSAKGIGCHYKPTISPRAYCRKHCLVDGDPNGLGEKN
jgi:hypothetical protein